MLEVPISRGASQLPNQQIMIGLTMKTFKGMRNNYHIVDLSVRFCNVPVRFL